MDVVHDATSLKPLDIHMGICINEVTPKMDGLFHGKSHENG